MPPVKEVAAFPAKHSFTSKIDASQAPPSSDFSEAVTRSARCVDEHFNPFDPYFAWRPGGGSVSPLSQTTASSKNNIKSAQAGYVNLCSRTSSKNNRQTSKHNMGATNVDSGRSQRRPTLPVVGADRTQDVFQTLPNRSLAFRRLSQGVKRTSRQGLCPTSCAQCPICLSSMAEAEKISDQASRTSQHCKGSTGATNSSALDKHQSFTVSCSKPASKLVDEALQKYGQQCLKSSCCPSAKHFSNNCASPKENIGVLAKSEGVPLVDAEH